MILETSTASVWHSYLMPYRRRSFSSDSNMATMAVDISNNGKVTMTVQLAIGKDVSAIAVLARELTNYEKLAHICKVTYAKLLESNFWKQPAF
jgi:6-phosphogluconate dehydrogenase (decarboxylating)